MAHEEDDALWRDDAARHGWALPPKAAWPLRMWGIRYIRYLWMDFRVYNAAHQWASVGIGFGKPNQRDLWVLYAIFRGWC